MSDTRIEHTASQVRMSQCTCILCERKILYRSDTFGTYQFRWLQHLRLLTASLVPISDLYNILLLYTKVLKMVECVRERRTLNICMLSALTSSPYSTNLNTLYLVLESTFSTIHVLHTVSFGVKAE